MSRIYRSSEPSIRIPETSIFTHVFSKSLDPKLPAYIDAPTGFTLSIGDVRSQSLQLAWGLGNILGQKRGSTMALFSPNSVAWPVVLLGGIAAGLRVTTISSSFTPSEILPQLKDSDAYYVFTHPTLIEKVRDALTLMKVSPTELKERIILVGPPASLVGYEGWRRYDDILGKGQLEKEVSFDGSASRETALLCYSSGTTSKSKGVELSHYNVVSVMCLNEPRFQDSHTPGSVGLSVLPYYHIYGLGKLITFSLYSGVAQVVMSHFNPDDFCSYIERYKVKIAFIVPPILVVLTHHPAPDKYDMSSLKLLFCGAAPLSKDLMFAVYNRLEKRACKVSIPQGWGQTETSPTCTGLTADDWLKKSGSIGRLLSNVEARLVLDDGVTDVADGESGEIWIRGPNVMKGYLNNPSATRDAITPDGWYKTGDIGTVDKDGYFYIIDRKKELIKYKGFQVPPADLEGVLLTHPNVVDAGVIGVWSEAEATEYPRAYVVPRGGAQSLKTSAEKDAFGREVQTWIRNKVARHKYLRGGVVVVDVIPKSASGKILRRELRELAQRDVHVTGFRSKL